jgi:hypothetical protein
MTGYKENFTYLSSKSYLLNIIPWKKKHSTVKESRNRPAVAQRVPGALDYQISMTFGT